MMKFAIFLFSPHNIPLTALLLYKVFTSLYKIDNYIKGYASIQFTLKVMINFPPDLLNALDDQMFREGIKYNGKRFNRSAFICRIIDEYLKIHRGIPYMMRSKQK